MSDDGQDVKDDAAKDAARMFGAEGGRKRARNLTPARRREIAALASAARWELPHALCTGELRLGPDLVLPCAVLSDGKTRVLTQSDFMTVMGMYYSGWVAKNRSAEDIAADVPHFFGFKSLKPFIDKHFGNLQDIVVKYRSLSGTIANGIRAEIIPKICEVWLDADRAGKLGARQKQVAAKAELLMRALAYKGIRDLVDEATGFDAMKVQWDVAKIIEAYVAKDLRQWVSTFPRSFFEELCRLRGKTLPEDMKMPQYFGHLINDLVYDRLAPGVKDELRRRNPIVDGKRKHKNHQFLTEQVGVPRLLHHLGVLEGLARGYGRGEYDKFRAHVDRALPNHGSLPLFAAVQNPKALRSGSD